MVVISEQCEDLSRRHPFLVGAVPYPSLRVLKWGDASSKGSYLEVVGHLRGNKLLGSTVEASNCEDRRARGMCPNCAKR